MSNPTSTIRSSKFKPGTTVDFYLQNADGTLTLVQGNVMVMPLGTVQIQVPYANGETFILKGTDQNNRAFEEVITISDRIPPAAPTDLDVSLNGDVLTGKAQPGSKIEIKDPNGIVIGTTTTRPDGTFEVTLTPPQKNGENLAVTAEDAAGKSPEANVTAPDLTPPATPTDVSVNADGTIAVGKAQPGSQVEIKDPNGNVIGTTTTRPDGTFIVDLSPAQQNGEQIEAIASDAGGPSAPAYAFAPDITPPDLGQPSIDQSTGSTISGTAEALSIITVTDNNGNTVATGQTDSSGQYTLQLNKPYQAGETLFVTAQDAAGNQAGPNSAQAPVLILANDDVIRADVDLAHTVTSTSYSEQKCFGSLGKFLGIPILGSKAAEINFNVSDTQKTGVDITATNFGKSSLFDAVRVTLYKQETNGSWTKVASDKDVGLFNKFFLFFPEQARIKTANDLGPGNYKIIAEDLTLFSFLSANTLNVKYTTQTTSSNLEVQKANTVTGNILVDDLTTPGTHVSKLTNSSGQSVDVPASGDITLAGKYGTMILKADGSYSYTPNKNLNVVGQVDEFTYTIKDQLGNTSEAQIYVQVGTDETKLEWDANDPSQAAKTLKLVDDVDTVKISTYKATKNTSESVDSGELAVARNSSSSVASKTFTVGTGAESTINVSIKAAYDQTYFGTKFKSYQDPDDTTFSWQLQKLNTVTGKWENVSGSAGSKYFDNCSSGLWTDSVLLNAQLSVKEPGQYRVQFNTQTGRYGAFSAQEFDTDVVVNTKHATDAWNQGANGSTTGNIFTGVGTDTAATDSLGVFSKKLAVSVDGGQTFVDVNAATTLQGTAGKLVINANGDYTYTQTSSNPVADNFIYKVTTATGETATAKLTIGFENTVYGTSAADTISSGAVQHILELGAGADTVKFTALNEFEADIWTDFSKAEGDKLDVSALLSGSGANAQNISDYISVQQDGTSSVIKIDLDGKGTQYAAQDLVILEKNQLSLDDLLQGGHLVF